MPLPHWVKHLPWEETPRFYYARPCPGCQRDDLAVPQRAAPPGHPEAIRARCRVCGRAGAYRPTWREALADFYGPLQGRSPVHGPPVGAKFVLKVPDPPVFPLKKLRAGEVVTLLDFETGSYTVRRDSDGLEEVIAWQNIGERVEE